MSSRPWAVLGLIAVGAVTNVVFTGCGSEDAVVEDSADGGDESSTNNGNEAGVDSSVLPVTDTGAADAFLDAFLDAITDGGRDPDAAICTATGAACTKSTECCTANCDATSGKCIAPNTLCKLPGQSCVTGNQCCTFSCIGGTCSNKQCVADNQACGADNECCGGKCAPDGLGGGKCAPLNPGGPATSGNPCAVPGDCASKFCNNGICSNPSFCVQNNDICSTASECCGGVCTKAPGNALGICALPSSASCDVGGTVCTLASPPAVCGGKCCSKSCAPYGPTGVPVCQPESGCRVTDSICSKDADCCGALGAPGSTKGGPGGQPADVHCTIAAGATVGRCDNGSSCVGAGNVCKLNGISCSQRTTCCAGNSQQFPTCKQDALGIPRCTAESNYDCAVSGPPPAGTGCASSADCCGTPCVPNPAGGQPAFICAPPGSCVPSGGTCSSTADCCAGLPCAIAPGTVKGICGGTVLADGGVSTTPPPGSDGGVVQPPADGGIDAAAPPPPICALYGQVCAVAGDCCSSVPCTNGTCHYP